VNKEDEGIDGVPISADIVTLAPSGGSDVTNMTSKSSSQQPVNDVDSDDEDEWKGVPPQGTVSLS